MRDKSFLTFGQLHSVAEDLSSRAIRVAQFLGRSNQLRSIHSDREIFPLTFSASGSSYTRVHGIVANILINSKICQSSEHERIFLSQKSVQPSSYSLFLKICQPDASKTIVSIPFHAVTIRNTLNRSQPNTPTNRPRTMSTIDGQPERVAGAVRTSA